MSGAPIIAPLAPFAQLPLNDLAQRGLVVSDRDGLGIATVLVRKNKEPALRQRLREQWAIELPQGPHRSTAEYLALAGTGPGAWLALREGGGNAFAANLSAVIGDLACVSDQSDGYAVLRLEGPRARAVLAKMFAIDLHPQALARNAVAVTGAGYMGVTLWQCESIGATEAFEALVYRSLAASFWHLLVHSAAD